MAALTISAQLFGGHITAPDLFGFAMVFWLGVLVQYQRRYYIGVSTLLYQ